MSSVINSREGMRFGMGVDRQMELVRGEALKFDRVADRSGGQRVKANFKKIDSQEQLMESMSLSVSASISYGLTSVDAKMDFAREHSVNDYTVYLLLEASVLNPPRYMEGPKLTDESLGIYKRDPEEFRHIFGDMYIDEIYGGGDFFGLFMFHTHDESTKTSISAELNISVGTALAGGSIKASFKSSIENISKQSSTDIKVIMSGGSGLRNPRNIGELEELYRSFNISAYDHPVDYKVGLKEFIYLPLPEGPTWVEQLVRRDTIETCGRNVVEAIKQRSRLDYILQYPTEFEPFDEAVLRAKQKEVNALIPRWAGRAQECGRDVTRCDLSGLEPVSFAPPARLVVADPIAAKLEYVQKHDSRARGYFLDQFLNGNPISHFDEHKGGRYKIFANGAQPMGGIFWHPQLANGQACVVYGLIFLEYLSRGHCEGPLGFPTTDEETLTGSRNDRVSTFQNGVLWWDAVTGKVSSRLPGGISPVLPEGGGRLGGLIRQ